MSKKKVVYLISSPLSKRDYFRLGLNVWIKRGWNVKVLDFTKFLKLEVWKYLDGENLSYDFEGLKIIGDEKFAFEMINSLERGLVFIDILGNSSKENKIRHLARNKGVIVTLSVGLLPKIDSFYSILFEKVKMVINQPSYLLNALFLKINHLKSFNYFDYIVTSGSLSNKNSSRGNTSVIKAHSLDYDRFLANYTKIENINNTLVFLDSDEAYHPDFIHLGIKPYVSAENYYPIMDKGLLMISKALNFDIKIAAHPRSDYENRVIKYKHPIINDQTFDLISQANVVLSHGSTALHLAILMRKPIILITTNELKKSRFNNITEGFSASLGIKIINLNSIPENYDWKSQLAINENRYEAFIEKFIKQSGTPNKYFWDIVIDRFEN